MSVDFATQSIIKINVKTLENKKIWGRFFEPEQEISERELKIFREEKLFEGTSINKETFHLLLEEGDEIIKLINSEKNEELIKVESELRTINTNIKYNDKDWTKKMNSKEKELINLQTKILKDKIGDKHILEWALENDECINGDFNSPFEPLKDKGDIIKVDGDWIYIQTFEMN